ncbi:MAG: nitrate ABC transporter ATP-binding protein [Legionellales bacterium]|nr:nitrate ABC transporter ATP-binding protein [Legionellales bacterium]|tara:strand:- start:222 stop:1520 length:1299 start_codon:yes stop_codon:yes gene_type:complete
MTETPPIILANQVTRSFRRSNQSDLLVLDKVNLTINPGEVVCLLGKSGSGKSTLLRIVSGLLQPSSGQCYWYGKPVDGPVNGLSMVFQNFALLPWLNVLENVELGAERLKLNYHDKRKKALEAIDTVGLDGFESAYPKELSGGMSQRVGLARALVAEPDLLVMDEPFSALDILTSENLRNDLIDLWVDNKTKIKSILIVTHNMEEAAQMADRILIFGNNPGHIHSEIVVNIPHPREQKEQATQNLIDEIYQQISDSSTQSEKGLRFKFIPKHYRLPSVEISEITGILETLITPDFSTKANISELADAIHLEIDSLFSIIESLEILRLAYVLDSNIFITEIGKKFAGADIQDQKKIFTQQLLAHITLARHIRRVLDERKSQSASYARFHTELQDHLTPTAAAEVLKVVIEWGRYAEIFSYNANSGELSLEDHY